MSKAILELFKVWRTSTAEEKRVDIRSICLEQRLLLFLQLKRMYANFYAVQAFKEKIIEETEIVTIHSESKRLFYKLDSKEAISNMGMNDEDCLAIKEECFDFAEELVNRSVTFLYQSVFHYENIVRNSRFIPGGEPDYTYNALKKLHCIFGIFVYFASNKDLEELDIYKLISLIGAVGHHVKISDCLIYFFGQKGIDADRVALSKKARKKTIKYRQHVLEIYHTLGEKDKSGSKTQLARRIIQKLKKKFPQEGLPEKERIPSEKTIIRYIEQEGFFRQK